MSNFLDKLQNRKNASVTLAHRIALHLSRFNEKILIVEGGEDLYFYSSMAKRELSASNLQFFIGGGRKNVLDTIDALDSLGKSKGYFAIVDRDFNFEDPVILNGNILVIDVHSFENFFGERAVLIDIGRAFFGLEPGEDLEEWSACVSQFLSSIETELIYEHALAVFCFNRGLRCLLSNVSITDILEFSEQGNLVRTNNATNEFIRQAQVDVSHLNQSEIDTIQNLLKQKSWREFVRSHYFWTCFVKVMNNFRKKLDEKLQKNRMNRARTRSELTSRHALEAATPQISTPPMIQDFLLRTVAAA